jgi:hypothetical protein
VAGIPTDTTIISPFAFHPPQCGLSKGPCGTDPPGIQKHCFKYGNSRLWWFFSTKKKSGTMHKWIWLMDRRIRQSKTEVGLFLKGYQRPKIRV